MAFPFARTVAGWLTRSSMLPALPTAPALEASSPARWSDTRVTTSTNPTLANGSVRQKARFAVQNDPILANAAAAWQSGLVGAGAMPASTVTDPEARARIMAAWNAWAPRADVSGRGDVYAVQALVARTLAVDGEVLVALTGGPELRLHVLSVDLLANDLSRTIDGGQIIGGIEFNSIGERTGYHIRVDAFSLTTHRIDAADMLHIYRQDAPGQIRGLSWFAPVLVGANELAQLQDAMLVGQKIAAMHAGFLIDQNATGGIPYEGTQQGSILTGGLEPGTLKVLPSGFDIKFSSPQQVSTGLELAKLNIRSISAGLGLPDFVVSGDLSNANYSSLRAGLVSWQRKLDQYQYHILVPQLLTPIWRRWLTLEVLSGRLDGDLESWLGVEHYFPPLPWVDPLKDAQAQAELVANGFASRRSVVSSMGYSVEAVDAEIAADRARERELGLSFAPAPIPGAANG